MYLITVHETIKPRDVHNNTADVKSTWGEIYFAIILKITLRTSRRKFLPIDFQYWFSLILQYLLVLVFQELVLPVL